MTQEALKLALEALEDALNKPMWNRPQMTTAITDIKEALAEHAMQDVQRLGQEIEQEPVAYAVYHRMGGSKSLHWPEQHSSNGDESEYRLVPLSATPSQRTWVGLTDEEIDIINYTSAHMLAREVEAKLKEKNNGV